MTRNAADAEDLVQEVPDADVVGALQRIPESFRVAMYLAYVEGFQYHEIADIARAPIGTVTSRLHRGRHQLRTLLESYSREKRAGQDAPADRRPQRTWQGLVLRRIYRAAEPVSSLMKGRADEHLEIDGPTSRRAAWTIAATGLAAVLLLTLAGPYEIQMVSGNTNPPTLALLALATTQVGIVIALREPANRWLHRRRPWTAVVAVNAVVLTVSSGT